MTTFVAGKGFKDSHEIEVLLASKLLEKPEDYKKCGATEPCIRVKLENGTKGFATRSSIFGWNGEFRLSREENGVFVEASQKGVAKEKYWLL